MNKFLAVICLVFLTDSFQPTFNFCGNNGTLAFDKSTSNLLLTNNITSFNGRLKLFQPVSGPETGIITTSGSNTIQVDGGSIVIGTNQLDLQGNATYTPAATAGLADIISLGNGQILSVSAGTTIYNTVNLLTASSATIIGTPIFNSDITMADSTVTLNAGIEHRLNKNIIANGGKIVLLDDLEFQDGVRVKFGGTVDVNLQSFILGTAGIDNPWSGTLTFWRADDIQLLGPTNLTGVWFFQTNSTNATSVLNGNGNVLTLSGKGAIKVGDSAGSGGASSGSHTLYINDLQINGLQDFYYYVGGSSTPVMTAAQFNASSPTPSSTTQTQYANANADGFTVLASSTSTVVPYFAIALSDSVYSGSSIVNATTPYLYGTTNTSLFNRSILNAAPTTTNQDGSHSDYVDVDIGVDGVAVAYEAGTNNYVTLFSAEPTAATRTVISAASTYKAVTIGDNVAPYIYAVTTAGTAVHKYVGTGTGTGSGTGVTAWNTFASGYTNIVDIAASNDGWVWILDNLGSGNYAFKMTNGTTTTTLSLPTSATDGSVAPTSYNSGRNAISVKGPSTAPFATYCGADGHLYFSVDGIHFDVMDAPGTYGASAAAVSAMGTIAVLSDNDAAYSGSTGLPVFIRPEGGNKFNLFGNTTSGSLGEVVLSNVTLSLKGNYTHSSGEIYIRGNNCTLVTGGTNTLNIANANTPITVDSVALIFETLGGNNVSPFATSTNAPTLVNGAVVRSAISSVVTVDTIFDAGTTHTPSALTQNYSLFTPYTVGFNTLSNRIVVNNSAAPTAETILIDGGNYYWYFPTGSGAVLTIANDVTVTLQNVTLKNFSLNNVSFGTNSTLVFGNGCVVELGADQTLSGNGSVATSTNIFNFATATTYTSKIRGQGQTIYLTNTEALLLSGAGTLVLENLNIRTSNLTALACTSTAGTIQLTNCNLIIDTNGLNYTKGNMIIDGWTRVRSANTTSGSTAVLSFQMTNSPVQNITINSGAIFEIDRNCTLNYACATRTQFVWTDNSSTLYFNNSNLDSTSNSGIGVLLGYNSGGNAGNIVADNKVQFTAGTTTGQEIEISAATNFEVLAAATLQVVGNVKYIA